MEMVLHRDYVLATTKGHRIEFKKGKPVSVPNNCIVDATAIGALPADGSAVDIIEPELKKRVGPESHEERQVAIFKAFDAICAANLRDDFTAAGVPQLLALEREVGWDVDSKERNAKWQAYRDAKASEGN